MGARLIIITTAGDPTHFSYEIRAHAEGDPLWRLIEAHKLELPVMADARRRLIWGAGGI